MNKQRLLYVWLLLSFVLPLYGMNQTSIDTPEQSDTALSVQYDASSDTPDGNNSDYLNLETPLGNFSRTEQPYDAPSSITINVLEGPDESFFTSSGSESLDLGSQSSDMRASLSDSIGSIAVHDPPVQKGHDNPPHAPQEHVDLSSSHFLRAMGALGSEDRGYFAGAIRAFAGVSGNLCLDQAGIGHIQERKTTEAILKAVALQRKNGHPLKSELSDQYRNRCVAVIDASLFLQNALENISHTRLDDGQSLIKGTKLFLVLHKDRLLPKSETEQLEILLKDAQAKIASSGDKKKVDRNT